MPTLNHKANTYVELSVGPENVLAITNGVSALGGAASTILSIVYSSLDEITITLAQAIDDRPSYVYMGVNEFSGSIRHAAMATGAVYVAKVPGLGAWLADGPKTAMTLNFGVSTADVQFAEPNEPGGNDGGGNDGGGCDPEPKVKKKKLKDVFKSNDSEES